MDVGHTAVAVSRPDATANLEIRHESSRGIDEVVKSRIAVRK